MQTYFFFLYHLLSAFMDYLQLLRIVYLSHNTQNIYLHSLSILLRFQENQQLKLGTSLEFLKSIKKLSGKQLFALCHVPPYAFCHLPHIQTLFL